MKNNVFKVEDTAEVLDMYKLKQYQDYLMLRDAEYIIYIPEIKYTNYFMTDGHFLEKYNLYENFIDNLKKEH